MPVTTATRNIKRKRKINPMPKALDYAYACKNGVLKCFNTHGLTYNDFNQWTVVHDMSNCAGTAVPDCGGNGPWWGTGASGGEKNPVITSAPYDYVVTQRVGKNRIDFFGVIVKNDDSEDYYPLNQTQFTELTGQKKVILSGDRRVYRPYYLTGSKLFDYNLEFYKAPSKSVADAKAFMNAFKQDSLVYFVEYLDYNGIAVKDNNDLAEVFTKYVALVYPNLVAANVDYANLVVKYYTARTKGDLVPMEKSFDIGGFDFGAILSGAIGLIMEGVNMIMNEAIRGELTQWINWFNNQMQIDYNDLVTFHAEKGPRFAADYITRLETTSWRDIRNYIVTWCGQKGVSVPPEIKIVFDGFTKLKELWIEESKQPGADPDYTPEPTDPSGSGTPPSESGPSTGLLIGVAIGIAVLWKIFS
jgi:roadblock/LC7 domain-containing protein